MFISKLPNQGVTVFTIMSKMATEHNAINLFQGFPEFDVSKEFIASVHNYMQAGYNQYASVQGVPRLREAIAKRTGTACNYTVKPESEMTIPSVATEGLYAGTPALVHNGHETIIFALSYVNSYTVKMAGDVPVPSALMPLNFNIDRKKVHKQGRKVPYIITPHHVTYEIRQKQMAEHQTKKYGVGSIKIKLKISTSVLLCQN